MFKDLSRDDNLNLMLDNAFKMRIKDIRTTTVPTTIAIHSFYLLLA